MRNPWQLMSQFMCNPWQSSLGLMSGSSLDGLDIAFCRFKKVRDRWKYEILRAETVPCPPEWQHRLMNLPGKSAVVLAQTDIDLGHFMGACAREFIRKHRITPGFIASHGHTIFHQPGNHLTLQIGKGAAIAAETGIPVVCDFRSTDVALGGQGAPLAPIGDQLLFSQYDYCLNLGGFSNISFDRQGVRIAFDICPCHIVLNKLATLTGQAYDQDGLLARQGKMIPQLLEDLNRLIYYQEPPPKSLGQEWIEVNIDPIMAQYIADPGFRIPDLLHTFSEHAAIQIGKQCDNDRVKKLLITGGGALNRFLIERIRYYAAAQIVLPDLYTIHFKEALIFAFLGLLRWRNEINCLASVTGAPRDNIGGAIYL